MVSVLSDEEYAILQRPLFSLREYLKEATTLFVSKFWIPVQQGKALSFKVIRRRIPEVIERIKAEDSALINAIVKRQEHRFKHSTLFLRIREIQQVRTGEDILEHPDVRECLKSLNVDSSESLSIHEYACADLLFGPLTPFFTQWTWQDKSEGIRLRFTLVWVETQNKAFTSALEEKFWPKVAEEPELFDFYYKDARENDFKALYLKELEEHRFDVADRYFTYEFLKQYHSIAEAFYPDVILDETTFSVWYQVDLFGTSIGLDSGINGLVSHSPLVYAPFESIKEGITYEMENPFFRLRDGYRCFNDILLDQFLIKIPLSIDEQALITKILQNIQDRKAILDEGTPFVLDDPVAHDYQQFQTQVKQMRKLEDLWPLLTDLEFHKRLDQWAESAQQLVSELQRFRSAIQVLLSSGESDLQMVLQILRQDRENFDCGEGEDYPGLTRDEVIAKWRELLQAAGETRVSTTLEKALRLRLRRLEEELHQQDEVEVVQLATGGRPKTVFKYQQIGIDKGIP